MRFNPLSKKKGRTNLQVATITLAIKWQVTMPTEIMLSQPSMNKVPFKQFSQGQMFKGLQILVLGSFMQVYVACVNICNVIGAITTMINLKGIERYRYNEHSH